MQSLTAAQASRQYANLFLVARDRCHQAGLGGWPGVLADSSAQVGPVLIGA